MNSVKKWKEKKNLNKIANQVTNDILCGSFERDDIPESKKKVISKSMYRMYKQNKGRTTNIKAEDYKKSCIKYLHGTEKKHERKKNYR